MTIASLQEIIDTGTIVVSLTVEQYHDMIRTGILREGEPIELIDGLLVRKDRSAAGESPMTVGHLHAWVLARATRLSAEVERLGGQLRIQQPITLPPDDEPEPDVAIAISVPNDYIDRHPHAADVSCIIEVADSSLTKDRTTKSRIYATHAIEQYIIVNLVDRVIEEYFDPNPVAEKYENVRRYGRGQFISLRVGSTQALSVPTDTFLPE